MDWRSEKLQYRSSTYGMNILAEQIFGIHCPWDLGSVSCFVTATYIMASYIALSAGNEAIWLRHMKQQCNNGRKASKKLQ